MSKILKRFLVVLALSLGLAVGVYAQGGGCVSDAGCKNGRVCRNGECMDRAQGVCTKDTDCPDQDICRSGQCVKAGRSPGTSQNGTTPDTSTIPINVPPATTPELGGRCCYPNALTGVGLLPTCFLYVPGAVGVPCWCQGLIGAGIICR